MICELFYCGNLKMKSMLICLIFLTVAFADPNYVIKTMVCTTENQCIDNIVNNSPGETTCVGLGVEGAEEGICECDDVAGSGWLIYSTVPYDGGEDIPDDAELTCYKAVGATCTGPDDCVGADSALSHATCDSNQCVCDTNANNYEDGAFCEEPSAPDNNYACKSYEQCHELHWYGFAEASEWVDCGGSDHSDRHCFCTEDDTDVIHQSYLYINHTIVHSCGREHGSACDDVEGEEDNPCAGLPWGVCSNDECVCDDGYFLINGLDCVRYATIDDKFACQDNLQCSHIANHQNISTDVPCENNVCTCPDDNYSLQRVVADQDIYACYVDIQCSGNNNVCDEITDDSFMCHQNVTLDDNQELDQRCQCMGGYIAPNDDEESDETYMCVEYASEDNNVCQNDLQCSIIMDEDADDGFATCNTEDEMCQCSEDNKFVYSDDNTPFQCVLRLGENCNSNEDCKIANSFCDEVCVCDSGYEAIEDDTKCNGGESAAVVSLMTLLLGLLLNKFF